MPGSRWRACSSGSARGSAMAAPAATACAARHGCRAARWSRPPCSWRPGSRPSRSCAPRWSACRDRDRRRRGCPVCPRPGDRRDDDPGQRRRLPRHVRRLESPPGVRDDRRHRDPRADLLGAGAPAFRAGPGPALRAARKHRHRRAPRRRRGDLRRRLGHRRLLPGPCCRVARHRCARGRDLRRRDARRHAGVQHARAGPGRRMTRSPRWAKVLDQTRCIGCHACSTACKAENGVPLGVFRTYVKAVEIGTFPAARRAFQVTRCNQCDDAPCTIACPTRAMYRRPDGIVDFDKRTCIGCKACIAACPYDAIFINPDDGSAEKCNLCSHRVDAGLEPACVTVCPTQAIVIGDLDDPSSEVARIVQRGVVAVRRPEKETRPKVFYRGAHQATLDPLAARRPPGGLYAWSEQGPGPSGHPGRGNTAAAAILAYDVPHATPWNWRVSLYTWTKSIAAGVYLVAAALVVLGVLPAGGAAWRWVAPAIALGFLGLTGVLLLADLEHPLRFYMIFT